MMENITRNVLWSESQYGCKKGWSYALKLLDVLDKWSKAVDMGESIDVVYPDFHWVLDSVPMKRLMKKIQAFSITSCVLNWIGEFLENRR